LNEPIDAPPHCGQEADSGWTADSAETVWTL
jgi:hypothetical protein